MANEDFDRKLTAILSADVVGYSRLMGDDEAATVSTLKSYRHLITEKVQKFKGRVVDSPGDNILSEFRSIVDAVSCAVEIQNILKEQNEELPQDRKMVFRIGVNLGDVIQDGNRIYGDGVNIAARIESLAKPGEVAISGTAFDNVRNKLKFGFEFVGEHKVKNIAQPVRVYRLLTDPASSGKIVGEPVGDRSTMPKTILAMAVVILLVAATYLYIAYNPAKDISTTESLKPSIAVLPFNNISNDPDLDYLCDGLTESLISTLSKVPDLFVIARNSTFTYKGKDTKIKKIAEELDVQYVIEGSVQKFENRLRLVIQMVDAPTERHVFSEKFDRNLKDLFELQDEIILEILRSVEIKRTEIERGEIYNIGGTDNLDAYLKYLKANYTFQTSPSEGSFHEAKRGFEEAIAIDPNYAMAYGQLGRTYQELGRFHSSGESRTENFNKGKQLALKAIKLDKGLSPAHTLLGISYLYEKEYDSAASKFDKAIELDPSDPHAKSWMAMCLIFNGKFEESLKYAKEAIQLDPLWISYYWRLSRALFHLNQYEDAIIAINKVIELGPPSSKKPVHIYLAMIYSDYGKKAEAHSHMQKVLEFSPNFNLEARRRSLFFKNPKYADREINALRMAGAPEHPPAK